MSLQQLPSLVVEFRDMAKEYLIQETVVPAKRLGHLAGYSFGAAAAWAVAILLLAVASVRAIIDVLAGRPLLGGARVSADGACPGCARRTAGESGARDEGRSAMTDATITDAATTSETTISRDDLETKLRQIEDVVDDTARDWSMWIVGGLAVAAVVVIGVGVWRARRRSPITVEVYHNP